MDTYTAMERHIDGYKQGDDILTYTLPLSNSHTHTHTHTQEISGAGASHTVRELEASVQSAMEGKILTVESQLVQKHIESIAPDGSWKVPFTVLFLFFIASCIAFYAFYSRMVKKMHYI
jgi:hypothetical protein